MNRRRMHRKRTKVTFKDLKGTLDEFGGTLGGFRTDMDDVKGAIGGLRTDMDEVKGTLSEFRTALGDINETLGFIVERMATKEDVYALQTQLNSIESDIRGIKNERLGVRVADLEEKVFGKPR